MNAFVFVLAFFGFLSFLEISSLKERVKKLEAQLARLQGTSYHDERISLQTIARSYIGEPIHIELKEDYRDIDIMTIGNRKTGSLMILDVDKDWLLIQIDSGKVKKKKLIRLEGVKNIKRIMDNQRSE
ncbi:MAG: hypothetical protein J6D36_04715 [Erysipelotrichaceae bacterium]|nr:hypothetical protein [Erysipelotrichaceae bacterium]